MKYCPPAESSAHGGTMGAQTTPGLQPLCTLPPINWHDLAAFIVAIWGKIGKYLQKQDRNSLQSHQQDTSTLNVIFHLFFFYLYRQRMDSMTVLFLITLACSASLQPLPASSLDPSHASRWGLGSWEGQCVTVLSVASSSSIL